MSRRFLPITTALALLALAGGCQSKATVVGKWKGREVTGLPDKTAEDKAAKELANKMAPSIEMEFKSDGTASMKTEGFVASGSYTSADGKISMTFTRMSLGTNSTELKDSKPVTLELTSDGKTLSMTPPPPATGTTVFERVSP